MAKQTSGQASAAAQQWDALVQDARREGVVDLYGTVGGGLREALVAPFEKAFPGIKVNANFGPASDLIARVIAERQARKFIADVIVGPAAQAALLLKPVGALQPIGPALVLPEVVDKALWLDNRYWWIDAKEPYTTFVFQGYVSAMVSYNTRLVDPQQFRSFQALLDPKWKARSLLLTCASRVPAAG